MRKSKKFIVCLVALVLVFQLLQLPVMQLYASGNAEDQTEAPSRWAVEHVEMARLYKLVDESMLNGFQQKADRYDLTKIGAALYGKLTGRAADAAEGLFAYTDDPSNTITRGDAVSLLYNVLKTSEPEFDFTVDASLPIRDAGFIDDASVEAVRYAVAKSLLKGTEDGKLSLDNDCTRQELITLAKRFYEFAIQEAGLASKGLMWKISGEKSLVYVLGSIHIADMSIYPFENSITDAFDKADYLAVEANIVPSNEDIMYMQQKAIYEDGTTIDRVVSEETYRLYAELMDAYAPALGIGPETYNLFKPWYASLLIPSLTLAENSFDAGLGIDLYFMNKAPGSKEIIEIEGLKFQVDMFENFSPELQEMLLSSALAGEEANEEGKSATVESMNILLAEWKEGDAEGMEAILDAAKKSDGTALQDEYIGKFWNERDQHMAETIKGFLADENGKTYFVIVGAGHLVGDTGVIEILDGQGYAIEQVLD